LSELRDLAESATAQASIDSYTPPDPNLKRAVDQQVVCKFSKKEALNDDIGVYRKKFEASDWGRAVIAEEPKDSNNARRCYYEAVMALYKVK
jgi:hypothetical protein